MTANGVPLDVLQRECTVLAVYGPGFLCSGKWSRTTEAIEIQCHHERQIRSKTGNPGTKIRNAPTLQMLVSEREWYLLRPDRGKGTLAMPGRFPYSPSHLEEILADMVKSAVAWDEHHGRDSEDSPQGEGLTQIPRRIHCPQSDRRPGQELSESEDEDGDRNPNRESTMDVRGPKGPSG